MVCRAGKPRVGSRALTLSARCWRLAVLDRCVRQRHQSHKEKQLARTRGLLLRTPHTGKGDGARILRLMPTMPSLMLATVGRVPNMGTEWFLDRWSAAVTEWG
jgi:hypothetical protein